MSSKGNKLPSSDEGSTLGAVVVCVAGLLVFLLMTSCLWAPGVALIAWIFKGGK